MPYTKRISLSKIQFSGAENWLARFWQWNRLVLATQAVGGSK
jgi:hypothetical protein